MSVTAEKLACVLCSISEEDGENERKVSVNDFFTYIHSRGYAKLLPSILAHYERIGKQETQTAPQILTVASERDLLAHRPDGQTRVVIDERIIGGYIKETKTAYEDKSHRNALLRFYKSISR